MNSKYIVSKKYELKSFWAQEAEMILTPISSRQWARKKFFKTRTYIMSRKRESNVFGAQEAEMTGTPISSLESARKKFLNPWRTSCLESRNQTFWAQKVEMTLTPISLLESARKKFCMNSTYVMSRKWESKFLGSGGRNDSNTHPFARISEKNFFLN